MPRRADAAEGDGWVLSVIYRGDEARSDLAVFEATDIAKGPVALAHLSAAGAGRLPRQLAQVRFPNSGLGYVRLTDSVGADTGSRFTSIQSRKTVYPPWRCVAPIQELRAARSDNHGVRGWSR